jgi:prepilin-type N-terminal cleavage/methylation domain-containing protein
MTKRTHLGFTLVELLTVIAIIALLVGILIPSLSAARTQARNSATASALKAVENGCELFRNENKDYPRSGGLNPFEEASRKVYLQGAQWLVLQLAGADLAGYVPPVMGNDTSRNGKPDGKIDHEDWREWYKLGSKFARLGPYVPIDGKTLRTPQQFLDQQLAENPPPKPLLDGSPDYGNARRPFFVDAHGYPILYYAANPLAKLPVSINTGKNIRFGVYDQSHNHAFTGYDGENGEFSLSGYNRGWDLAGTGAGGSYQPAHALGWLGWSNTSDMEDFQWPDREPSFGSVILNRDAFDQSTTDGGRRGRLEPFNRERFILVSAGKDGEYGTADDIRNFGAGR